jgi:peptidoglycan/LPS O-acetylase OafA/YrhL
MMKYRADVDGRRRYRADISSLPGGFIGVDVFFVISGYSDPLSAKVITRTGIENAGDSRWR